MAGLGWLFAWAKENGIELPLEENGSADIRKLLQLYDEWRAMMRRVDAGLDPSDSSAEIPQEQAEDERLGAAANAAGPRDYRALAESAALTTEDVATVE